MSHGMRPVPAARLAPLLVFLALAMPPGPCLGSPPLIPDSRLGSRTAPLLLLSRPDVCADLGLDDKQRVEAEGVVTAIYTKAATLVGKRGPEVVASQRAIDASAEQWLKTHLSDTQRRRLVEIDLQWEGPSALISRPVIADHIGLTPEQRARLKRAITDRDRRRGQGGDWQGIEHQLGQEARALLTPEQRERWYAMLGRRFTPQVAASGVTPPR